MKIRSNATPASSESKTVVVVLGTNSACIWFGIYWDENVCVAVP